MVRLTVGKSFCPKSSNFQQMPYQSEGRNAVTVKVYSEEFWRKSAPRYESLVVEPIWWILTSLSHGHCLVPSRAFQVSLLIKLVDSVLLRWDSF